MVLFTILGAFSGGLLTRIFFCDSNEMRTSGYGPSPGELKIFVGAIFGAGVGFMYGINFWSKLISG